MFAKTLLVSVGLPRGVWEPIRKLHDTYDVDLSFLRAAFGVSERDMAKVLYAARLNHLTEGEEVKFVPEFEGHVQ